MTASISLTPDAQATRTMRRAWAEPDLSEIDADLLAVVAWASGPDGVARQRTVTWLAEAADMTATAARRAADRLVRSGRLRRSNPLGPADWETVLPPTVVDLAVSRAAA